MASKVPVKPQVKKQMKKQTQAAVTTENEAGETQTEMVPSQSGTLAGLTSVASFLPQHDLNDEVESADSGAFFPQLKLVFPIEIRPDGPFKQNDSYVVGLSNGESFEALEAGYILSVLDSRNASREERPVIGENGKPAGKEYIRAYQAIQRGGKTYGKSDAVYAEQHAAAMQKTDGMYAGISAVVAVVKADGSVAIAEMPLFKTQRSYWQRHLMQTSVLRGVGIQVDIDTHFDNVVTSGSGNAYPSPKKFTQFDLVQLEKEQIAAIGAALEEVGDAYLQWIDR